MITLNPELKNMSPAQRTQWIEDQRAAQAAAKAKEAAPPPQPAVSKPADSKSVDAMSTMRKGFDDIVSSSSKGNSNNSSSSRSDLEESSSSSPRPGSRGSKG